MLEALLVLVLSAAEPKTVLDLSPLPAEAESAAARAAVADGRWADAASKLQRSVSAEGAFLRAVALVEAGRPGEALAPLQGLEARLPDLADRMALMRGRALESAGKHRESAAAFAAVPDGSVLAAEARLARAQAAAAGGDRATALEALVPLLGAAAPADVSRRDPIASALLLAGRLRADSADGEGARAAYVSCWARHPLAPESADCRAGIGALPQPWSAPPANEDVLCRAEALLDANRNDAALALLGPLMEALPEAGPGESFACRARAAAGRAQRKERRYESAMALLRPVAEGCEDREVRLRALYLLASATSIAGDKDESVALYMRLARDFPGHPFADDALFFAADLLVRAGRTAEAREALSTLVRDHPTGDYRNEARFRLAWLSRQAGDGDAAIAQLLAIEEDGAVDEYEHSRAAYWRARLLVARGDEGRRAAREIWMDLVVRHPADYYGLLSRARLVEDGAQPPRAPVSEDETLASGDLPPEAAALRVDPHFRAGVLLLRMGLARDAAEELGAIDPERLRGSSGGAPELVLAVADLLDRAGDHRAAHNLLRTRARGVLRRPPSADNLRAWRIAYPPAYRDDVRRWAPPAGVPVDLVQALMREESALDPRAISPAGAIGLTQLMLPTARSVARQLRLGRITRSDLTRASVNIRIGASYLGDLVRRFGGSIPLALAAYNAGGGAVSRWLAQRKGLSLDEFVEEIPVEETRGYVKRVLRSYAAYQLLYGESLDPASAGLLGAGGKS